MRRLFTVEETTRGGLTRDALRWGERAGRWRRLDRCVYAEDPEEPDGVPEPTRQLAVVDQYGSFVVRVDLS